MVSFRMTMPLSTRGHWLLCSLNSTNNIEHSWQIFGIMPDKAYYATTREITRIVLLLKLVIMLSSKSLVCKHHARKMHQYRATKKLLFFPLQCAYMHKSIMKQRHVDLWALNIHLYLFRSDNNLFWIIMCYVDRKDNACSIEHDLCSSIFYLKNTSQKQTFRLLFLEGSISVLLNSWDCVSAWEEVDLLMGSTSGFSTSASGSTGSDISGFSSFWSCSTRLCASDSFGATLVETILDSGCGSVLSQLGAWDEDWTCVCDGVQVLFWRWRGWCSLA